ncbi:MAG: septal ring lytic transglycosylase RlpA family protein [bacterium]|nr:septal ring lytic transglycosylase RlpA family protein [bacterium]
MDSFLRRVLLTIGCLLVFLLAVSCTSGRAQARGNDSGDLYGQDTAREGADDTAYVNEAGYKDESNNFGDDIREPENKAKDGFEETDRYAQNSRDSDSRRDNNDYNDRRSARGDRNTYDEPEYNESSVRASRNSREPRSREERFYQKGLASWYGREFHGKVTASGERFNMYKYTAAHKSLPFGTIVEIKNLKNGKIVKARINDRGPYYGKRIIDLSYNAAKGLGFLKNGEVLVGITVIKKGEERAVNKREKRYDDSYNSRNVTPVVNDTSNDEEYMESDRDNYLLQAGAFYSKVNARNLKRRLEDLTGNSVIIVNDEDLYKVRVKGFGSKNAARRTKRLLADENIPSFVVSGRN